MPVRMIFFLFDLYERHSIVCIILSFSVFFFKINLLMFENYKMIILPLLYRPMQSQITRLIKIQKSSSVDDIRIMLVVQKPTICLFISSPRLDRWTINKIGQTSCVCRFDIKGSFIIIIQKHMISIIRVYT